MKVSDFGISFNRGKNLRSSKLESILKRSLESYPSATRLRVEIRIHGKNAGYAYLSKTSLGWKVTISDWVIKIIQELDWQAFLTALGINLNSTPGGGLAGLVGPA